jgi:phosphonate transport system permease protein
MVWPHRSGALIVAQAIYRLPDRQAQVLLAGYAKQISQRRLLTLIGLSVVLALVVVCGSVAEVRPGIFFAHIGTFGDYIYRTIPTLAFANLLHDIAAWFWGFPKWLRLLGQTLMIAYLGTLFGTIFAFFLSFLASANLARYPAVRFGVRRLLEFLRTVPDIVFAMIFVVAFGIGPLPGVLGMALHTIGALGKLFAEVVENADMKPADGITASGGSWVQMVRFAIVPQVLPGFASYALLRFEINVRGAGVLGFVGAGGIGQDYLVAIRNYPTDASAILLMIIPTVIVIDMVTERLRHKLIGSVGQS